MQKLIFVYNANSGIGHMLLDVAHKIFSPKTYNCNLCALTFDTFSENKIWKDFRTQNNIEMVFLHIDDFEEKYKTTAYTYPIILTENTDGLKIVLSAESIDALRSVNALITILKPKLRQAPH